MGQVHVASVWVDVVPEVLAALGRAGFTVTVSATPSCGQAARCRRGNRESVISIYRNVRDPAEAFAVVGYPPYTVRPWRWAGDFRFFDDLTAVLDEFDFRE